MDPAHPHAEALAIRGGVIVAVGDKAEIEKLDAKRVIDARGATVTPGLIDAHCHLYGLGVDNDSVSVRALGSEEETVKVVGLAAQGRPAGEWLLGRGWDQNRWPGQQFPTKASLDAVVGDRPVVLRRVDGHASWVSSKALELAGITKSTPDPAGGKILRDAKGEPTGVLIDNAGDLVDAKMPAATPAIRERRIRAAARQAVAAGITGVHEMGIDDATAEVYAKLAAGNELPLRVHAFLAGDPTRLDRLARPPAPPIGRFEMRGVKFFADGALGSRGARLYEPYVDDPKNSGLWVTEPGQLSAGVEAAVSHGWQVAIHAIGDAGVGAVLDAYLAAQRAHPGDHRLRIEHTQVIAPPDIARMVAARAIASMQPTHATSDMPWAEQRVGAKRIAGAYAWRTMLDRKIPLAAGSDFPVEDVAPLLGIYAAVTRQDAKGNPAGGWYPSQKLTLDEAIAAFTSGAAYAEGHETTRGMIAVGRAADLTIFDRALAPDRTLLDTHVDYTVVDGQVVFQRQAAR
ncbi:MAG: amidohydrolase [Deltaproteobacteria bacterium]|nr:amidohydrolase [Deltaproteobacteria bacterium]